MTPTASRYGKDRARVMRQVRNSDNHVPLELTLSVLLIGRLDSGWTDVMPNKREVPIDLKPFGIENSGIVFLPTDEQHGRIDATVRGAYRFAR